MSKAAQVSAQLVSLVNPRLAMYTRAGLLAAIILSINFAIVGCLALVLQRDCTTSTVVDRSSPVTFGDFLTYEEFINTTLDREGVVKEDLTTTAITVDGCVKRNSAVLVAPYQATLCSNTCKLGGRSAENNGICEDGGPGNASVTRVAPVGDKASTQSTSMSTSSTCTLGTDCTDCGIRVPPPSYSGTGITTDVPCWNQYVPCFHPPPPPHPPPSPPSSPPDCSTIPAWCAAECAQYAPCLTSSSSDPACANAPSQCRQCINYAHCAPQGNGRALAEERRLFFGTSSPPPPSACPGGGINACPNPAWNNDGVCDDGGPGAAYNGCSLGSDCTDCGPRGGSGFTRTSPPPSPPPPPSPLPPSASPSLPPSPPPPSPSPPVSSCTDQLNSGLTYTDGTPVPCTYFTTTPAQCAAYPLALNNCPISCGSCQGVTSSSPPPPSSNCTNQINSGGVNPMLCTYFTTNPAQCNSNLDAQNNCPVSCRTCQGICMGTCTYASDGDCDDGGPGAEYAACAQGTDCSDCGPRALNAPPARVTTAGCTCRQVWTYNGQTINNYCGNPDNHAGGSWCFVTGESPWCGGVNWGVCAPPPNTNGAQAPPTNGAQAPPPPPTPLPPPDSYAYSSLAGFLKGPSHAPIPQASSGPGRIMALVRVAAGLPGGFIRARVGPFGL
jgi:hypothetical protein